MRSSKLLIVLSFLLLGLLTGCFASVDNEVEKAESEVSQVFKAKPEKPNKEEDTVSFYLPKDMKIEEKGENNYILKMDDQLFILFINPIEKTTSDVVYKSISAEDSEVIMDKTFEDKERFGYTKAIQLEKKKYELSVGIGGVKITTETKIGDLTENAKTMMKIVSSVKVK